MRKKALYILLGLCVISIGASARGITSTAMAKLDPRLTRLYTDPDISARPLGETITILGTSIDDAVVPVLIKTVASRSELEAVGAVVGSRHGDIVTARVPLEKLEELAMLPSVDLVEASYRLYDVLDVSTVECGGAAVHAGSPPYTGNGVIVGLLDSGIDPTHDDFEDAPNDTRVLYIWDQFGAGPAPSGYSYGTEWIKAQIDAGSCTMTDPNAHGSHCAGIAAGDGSSSALGYIGMAPDANIIMVANRSDDMFNYGGREGWSSTTAYSLDGLNYMSGKATGESMPLVVSWSQAVCMGPHDGSTLFEQGVDNFISSTNVPVVVAAGNNQGDDLHASGTVAPGSPVTVAFNVASAYASVPFEVWYALGDLMTLEILPPGEASWYGPYGPDTGGWTAPTNAHGDQMWIWGNDDHSTSHKGYFQVSLQNNTLGVDQGSWQVRMTANNALPQGGDFDIWFERNRPNVACQDHIDLTVILGMPATAHDVITVGSYCTKDPWLDIDGSLWTQGATVGVISSFSSNGPTADGRQKPDLSAPGQIVASVMSSGAAPTYLASYRQYVAPDGLHLYMSGTSMAAPHVAGTVALMLEHTPTLTASLAKMILNTTARDAGPAGWDAAYGWGKLDAVAAMTTVPVELSSFSGSGGNGYAVLTWATASEQENLGFHLMRSSSENGPFTKVNQDLIEGAGTCGIPQGYAYRDEPLPHGIYFYKLVDVSFDGATSEHGPIRILVTEPLPDSYCVDVQHGHPIVFRVTMPTKGLFNLNIYDVAGRLVWIHEAGELNAGTHAFSWSGTTEDGYGVSSGVYVFKASVDAQVATGKVVLVR